MQIINSTKNFLNGNATGFKAACYSIVRVRTITAAGKLQSAIQHDPEYMDVFKKASARSTENIYKAYAENGAPKSGKFFTQSVGEAAKKSLCFLHGNIMGCVVAIYGPGLRLLAKNNREQQIITHLIKSAYHDAPKSGEFFTQSVGDATKKLFKFLTGKK